MYAIVDIAGQQFKITKQQEIFVHRLNEAEGSYVSFNKVLLLDEDGKITVGKPYIEGISVSAKILNHLKGDKVLVFKKKRRKSYQKCNGHRQYLTKILIEDITTSQGKTNKKAKTQAKKENKEETINNDTVNN